MAFAVGLVVVVVGLLLSLGRPAAESEGETRV
jgi:hypothetical protein